MSNVLLNWVDEFSERFLQWSEPTRMRDKEGKHNEMGRRGWGMEFEKKIADRVGERGKQKEKRTMEWYTWNLHKRWQIISWEKVFYCPQMLREKRFQKEVIDSIKPPFPWHYPSMRRRTCPYGTAPHRLRAQIHRELSCWYALYLCARQNTMIKYLKQLVFARETLRPTLQHPRIPLH